MLAWDLGYKQVILETDLEYCLHAVIHLISSNHPQAQLIQACRNLVQRDWQWFCKHTHRKEHSNELYLFLSLEHHILEARFCILIDFQKKKNNIWIGINF